MKRARDLGKIAWFCVAPFLIAADTSGYRFERPIEGAAGWTELSIPDDVLDAARPGLTDVRVRSASGEEVAYAIGGPLTGSSAELSLVDVEQSEKETTALVDRGGGAPQADAVEFSVAEAEFIKPVTLEASADRTAWRQIARASIFAVPSGARVTRIHFAPNDRRYWRFRFDDRNGPPIKVSRVRTELTPQREAPTRVVPLSLRAEPDGNSSASTYSAVLPSANLPLTAMRIGAADAAFVRRVRIFERVYFRDEVSRRLLGEGDVARSGGGEYQLSVPLSEPAGKHLEIEIERPGGIALHDVTAEVTVRSPVLRFHAPADAALELVYGSNASAPPQYDLAAALRGGPPANFARATLGPAIDHGAAAPALPAVTRGAPLDTAGWKTEQPIVLPARGPIAFLDLERGSVRDVRIIDRERRQVPYLVESEPRHLREPVAFHLERAPGTTILHLDDIDPHHAPIDAIELEVAAPDFFERDVQVLEQLFDARGKTEERVIGSSRLVRAADRSAAPFRIGVSAPTSPELVLRIADGDNAPLTVASLSAEKSRRRVNFVFAPGDELRLLTDNGGASAPQYDLALVAAKVLASPAEPATLGPARTTAVAPKSAPAWFWIFVAAAALILLLALGRTLGQTVSKVDQ